ncbi:hypothetical protein Hanom_Chr12g01177451 [Helianthus anomalus]
MSSSILNFCSDSIISRETLSSEFGSSSTLFKPRNSFESSSYLQLKLVTD